MRMQFLPGPAQTVCQQKMSAGFYTPRDVRFFRQWYTDSGFFLRNFILNKRTNRAIIHKTQRFRRGQEMPDKRSFI